MKGQYERARTENGIPAMTPKTQNRLCCKRHVDISVHSDVKIFEWLLSYMQYSEY